jgi:glycosidase
LKFFDKDPIEWKNKCELHEFYKALLQLKKTHPALNSCDAEKPRLIEIKDQPVLAWGRRKKDRELFVAMNLSPNNSTIQLPPGAIKGTFTNLFEGKKITIDGAQSFELKPWEFVILTN